MPYLHLKNIWCCIQPPALSFRTGAVCGRFVGRVQGEASGGGVRVIYYFRSQTNRLFLIFAYPKNQCENLTPAQVRSLARIIERL